MTTMSPPKHQLNTTSIPSGMKELRQWVVYRGLLVGTGEISKEPRRADSGELASSTNPETWFSFDDAVAAAEKRGWGIGYVFDRVSRICGIDLDDCLIGGELPPWAQDVVDRFPSYTEVSVSGTGLHIFIKGDPPTNGHKVYVRDEAGTEVGKIEFYSCGRYFAMTGKQYPGTPNHICEYIDEANAFHAELEHWNEPRQAPALPVSTDHAVVAMPQGRNPLSDSDIIEILSEHAGNRQKFLEYFRGGFGGKPSNSEAVKGILCQFIFYTHSPYGAGDAQLERLFRQSQLCTPDYDKRHGGKESKAAYECGRAVSRYTGKYYEPGSTAERERKARSWEQYESSTRGQGVRTGTTALPQPADTNFDLTLSRLPHTDLGNAERLVARFGDNIRYCYEWKCWMSWSGTQWVQDKTGDIHRKAQSAARLIFREVSALTKHLADTAPAAPRSLLDPLPLTELDPVEPHKQSRTPEELLKWQKRSEAQSSMSAAAVLAQNQLGIPVLVDSLDTDNMLLNVRNGTINLRTGKLQDHRRNDLITKRVEIDFDPTAECPTWLRFLTEVSADADTVAFLKRAVGYTLTGDTSEDALFFCWGTGRNGKSTFMRVLEGLMGDYAVRLRAEALMTDKNPSANAATPALARLQGARLVAVSEIEEGRRLNEALIKDLTGNDKISARALYQDEFQFKPQFKAWLCGNHKPVIRGDDEGIWRRPKFVPFTVTIPEASKDTMLAAKLAAEMSGVLRWAVEGCLEWQRDGLNPSAAVLSATQGYREEMDVVGQFIGERCIVGAKFDVSATALFTGYTIWCETNGTRPMTMRAFGLRLTNKNYGTETNRRGVTRLGLGLKADLRYADAEVCEPCEPCEVKNSKTPPEKSHVYRNFSENGSQGSQGSHNHAEAEAVEQFTEEGEVVRI